MTDYDTLKRCMYVSSTTRQKGSTTAVCNAAKNSNGTVVIYDKHVANLFKQKFGIDTITVKELAHRAGNDLLLLYDKDTVERIFSALVKRIEELELENKKLVSKINAIKGVVNIG